MSELLLQVTIGFLQNKINDIDDMASINLFEFDNARNLSISQLVSTFIDTPSYWKLFSSKNHIVLGCRGSGKTSIAKMLSHTHLSQFDNEDARSIIKDKLYIGTYVPMNAEWLGSINDNKIAPDKQIELFKWKLNIKTCIAFVDTIKSCLCSYASTETDAILKEIAIVEGLKKHWFLNVDNIQNLKEVKEYLRQIDFDKQLHLAREKILGRKLEDDNGIEFAIDLFSPLKNGIDVLSECMDMASSSWFICLDEAEILTKEQQKIINSFLRSCSGNLFFKIITMPYAHTTRVTDLGANLNSGDDFEYVYIDDESMFIYDEKSSGIPQIVDTLFTKRASKSGIPSEITVQRLLGDSKLLDKHTFDCSPASLDMMLLEKYADTKTKERAKRLLTEDKIADFNNQIGRKMRGLLYLKDNVKHAVGRTKIDVYSGTRMVIQCADGNPRRLIRLFKLLLEKANLNVSNRNKIPILSPVVQSEILMSYSDSFLSRVQSEERIGPELYQLLKKIGERMSHKVHNLPLMTEQTYSIEITDHISDADWEKFQRAVDNGLLYPTTNSHTLPYKEGIFRMAYTLCPYFKLLPRKGSSMQLNSIYASKKKVTHCDDPTLF